MTARFICAWVSCLFEVRNFSRLFVGRWKGDYSAEIEITSRVLLQLLLALVNAKVNSRIQTALWSVEVPENRRFLAVEVKSVGYEKISVSRCLVTGLAINVLGGQPRCA